MFCELTGSKMLSEVTYALKRVTTISLSGGWVRKTKFSARFEIKKSRPKRYGSTVKKIKKHLKLSLIQNFCELNVGLL